MSPEQALRQADENRSRGLFFTSGGKLFVIGIDAVEEIVTGSAFTPVPLAPPSVVGVVNHRGRIYTVMDFARLAGLGKGEETETSVFLHRPEMAVGFAVTDVEDIEWVPRGLLERAAKGSEGEGQAFLAGLMEHGGRVAQIVDGERLADTISRLPGCEGEQTAGGAGSIGHGS